MSKLHKTLFLFTGFVILGIFSSVFAAQTGRVVNMGSTESVKIFDSSSMKWKYLYIKNNNTGNAMFVPYTDTGGTAYGCPTGNSNRTTWKFSNVYSDTTKVISGGKSVGPNRGIEISCGCPNPNQDEVLFSGIVSVPHNRSGDLYDTDQVAAGDTCASHKLHVLCDNGNISDTLGTHIYPTCLEAPQATCALKRFLQGVSSGTVTWAKVRASKTGSSLYDSTNALPYTSGYILGYGEAISGINYGYTMTTTGVGGSYILRSPVLFTDSYNRKMAEFELYGVTLATENVNRGCIDNTGYWVTSKVMSHQTESIQGTSFTPSKGRITKPDYSNAGDKSFGSNYSYIVAEGFSLIPKAFASCFGCYSTMTSSTRAGATLYGCQAELLPNPDAYCVEKVTNDGTAKAGFTTLYIKEFTKAAPSNSCTSVSIVPGKTFKLFTKEDMGYMENSGFSATTSVRSDRNLLHTLVAFSTAVGDGYGYSFDPSFPVLGENEKIYDNEIPLDVTISSTFLHGNIHPKNCIMVYDWGVGKDVPKCNRVVQSLYTPATAAFGGFLTPSSQTNTYNGVYSFGINSIDTETIEGAISIPLQSGYKLYLADMGFGTLDTYVGTGFPNSSVITKNVCYSYEPTCLPGYKFQTGVVGKYGDGCQPITPIPCTNNMACGVAGKCVGYQPATTSSCAGGNVTVNVDICSESKSFGYVGNTKVAIGGGGVRGSRCSASAGLVKYNGLYVSGANYMYDRIPASTFTYLSGSCHTQLNALCKGLTNRTGSVYNGFFTDGPFIGSSTPYGNKHTTITSCGNTTTPVNPSSSSRQLYTARDMRCTYPTTKTVSCSSLGATSCASAAGCTVVPAQSEVIGQCTR